MFVGGCSPDVNWLSEVLTFTYCFQLNGTDVDEEAGDLGERTGSVGQASGAPGRR